MSTEDFDLKNNNMSSKKENNKVKRTSLSIHDRCNILARLNAGESPRALAAEFNVTRQAVSKMKKNEKSILDAKDILANCDGDAKTKLKYRGTEENILAKKLFEWMKQNRSLGNEISGTIVRKKASLYNKLLTGNNDFKASDGWLTRFKHRHGLRLKSYHGEKKTASVDGSEQLKTEIENIIVAAGISRDCIYNCDETGLYWRMMPNKSLELKNEKKTDFHKKPKNRLTVMLCTNASGTHKLPLFVIGKVAQPRCFKDVKNVPVFYTSQENAWMTTDLMNMWYNDIFLPEVIQKHKLYEHPNTKIILIMDNAGCHPPADQLNNMHSFCTVHYLPPSVSALSQPLNQGIVEKFKRCYRNLLLEEMLSDDTVFLSMFENAQVQEEDFLKSFNLLRSLDFCSLAWNEITPDNIKICWKRLMPSENDDSSSEIELFDSDSFRLLFSRIPQYKKLSLQAIECWLDIDSEEAGWLPKSDDDIITGRDADVLSTVEELDDEVQHADDEASLTDSILNVNGCPTLIEALQASNILLTWYKQNGQNSDSDLLSLQRVNCELRHKLVHNIDT